MKTREAQRILLEILAGQRRSSEDYTRRRRIWAAAAKLLNGRPRKMREWDLAMTARPFFRAADGTPFYPHVERALFARALQRLRRAGLVQVRTRIPGLVWVAITKAGLKSLDTGLPDIQDHENDATQCCPRCGYYNPEPQETCEVCRQRVTSSQAEIAESWKALTPPDKFVSTELARLKVHRRRIHLSITALCILGLFLVSLALEGFAPMAQDRVLVCCPGSTLHK
jgi:hypothetical protein